MAGKQGYGRSPELSLKSTYIFSSTFEGSSHLERPERRFFRNLHFRISIKSDFSIGGFCSVWGLLLAPWGFCSLLGASAVFVSFSCTRELLLYS